MYGRDQTSRKMMFTSTESLALDRTGPNSSVICNEGIASCQEEGS